MDQPLYQLIGEKNVELGLKAGEDEPLAGDSLDASRPPNSHYIAYFDAFLIFFLLFFNF